MPPTGTVTFLFSDIEGSTRLLHAIGLRVDQEIGSSGLDISEHGEEGCHPA